MRRLITALVCPYLSQVRDLTRLFEHYRFFLNERLLELYQAREAGLLIASEPARRRWLDRVIRTNQSLRWALNFETHRTSILQLVRKTDQAFAIRKRRPGLVEATDFNRVELHSGFRMKGRDVYIDGVGLLPIQSPYIDGVTVKVVLTRSAYGYRAQFHRLFCPKTGLDCGVFPWGRRRGVVSKKKLAA